MKATFKTSLGEVTLQGAMIDINGTDLVDGIEIKIDGELVGEVLGTTFSEVEDMTVEEVEAFVKENVSL